jgi:lysozyme
MLDVLDIAIPLIQHYESCKLEPYADVDGVPTIGWGNTIYCDGSRVELDDQPLTQEEADKLFKFWLSNFADGVKGHAVGAAPNELAAFTSLAYNIGLGAFNKSTALREYLHGDKAKAAQAIELWNKANGTVLKGLQRRRRAESLVFRGYTVSLALAQAEKDFP